jgi:hypothetical protein
VGNSTIIIGTGVPIVRVGCIIRFALDGQILVFEQRTWITQLETLPKGRNKRFPREVELLVNVVGTVGFEKSQLE